MRPGAAAIEHLSRPGGSPMATGSLAAHLTWKQAELLLILAEGAKPLREIGEIVREIHEIDLCAGNRPMYFGVDDAGLRSCLSGLERRRLAHLRADDYWMATPLGRQVAEAVR